MSGAGPVSAAAAEPLDPAARARLEAWLTAALSARAVRLGSVARLSGGAIQENLGLELEIEGGSRAGRHALVLRRDAPSTVAVSRSRLEEYALLEAAHRAGVPVPEPWAACADPAVLGKPFYLMAKVAGEARGARLVKDPAVLARGSELAAELGRALARIHALRPPLPELPFLSTPADPLAERIAQLRGHLDALGEPQPVLEWGLRLLERARPGSGEITLVHADFRTGNLMLREGRLVAVLDWEFATLSDPLEDLGWMLAKCWRFGAVERECGGLGPREPFLSAYEAASGRRVDRRAVRFFELLATLRWAVVALLQAERHESGRERSLELALTAHIVPQLEADVLDYAALLEGTGP
ncbi:MAG: phosphotransferase family protein [Geminicoccaceae bacterium]|nr:phosphotransferase family protein [Geminicoccaceae bacterium]MDW8370899.1 phosphotransferase family protein [Geminicoccaceae bacterium]